MTGVTPKEMERRIKTATALLSAVFLFLGGRLWYLQLVRGEELEQKSRSNAIRLITIPAPRGVFYDRRHRPLVSSRLAFSVSIIPRELGPDPESTYRKLAPLIGLTPGEIAAEVKKGEAQPYFPVRLARDVDPATVTRVEEARLDLPGVIVEEIPVRNYIYGKYASHLFGYLGKVSAEEWRTLKDKGYSPSDVVGKTGLEKQYETLLRGKDGGQQVEVNRVNRPVRVLGTVEPVPGNSLVLTIDQKVQKAAEDAIDAQLEWVRRNTPYVNARGGAVVALDPNTGAILAMTSRPAFDPGKFVGGVSLAYWKEIVSDPANAFQNRATEAALAPGSTFKTVTAIAALAEGVTTREEIFVDRGRDPVYPQKACWLWNRERRAHGEVNIEDGLKVSCNIVFYELGRRLGIDRLADWARRLGLGTKTGLELYPGEYAGNVPDREWKRRAFRRPDAKIWYPIETLDVAIGQGALQVTPLQLASLYAMIANGGTLYRPYVVQSVLSPEGQTIRTYEPQVRRRLDFDPGILTSVKKGLADVVAGGTAAYAFAGFPLPVAAKTGTAEVSANSRDAHAWFAAFAPADRPQIVVVVMMERGGHGGTSAAPVARKVLEAFFGLDAGERSGSGERSSPGPGIPAAAPGQ
ncbi:MAG: penicillin-binding protein 2 [Bacillota bacterium]|nr:penicillin-binding protein 2 [Bacillota bacterium]